MRRCFAIIMASALLLLSPYILAQDKVEKAEKPLFFVNTNSSSSFFSGGNFGLTVLKELAEEAGYSFDHGLHPEINDDYLEGISVYYMPSRKDFLLDDEKAALKRYMKAGGVVIFCHYTTMTNENTFTKEFGIDYGGEILGDNYATIPNSSPLSGPYNVTKMRVGYSRKLIITDSSKAIPLVYTEAGDLIAAESVSSTLGDGKLFVLNTMRAMYDGTIAGYIDYNDNRNFNRNLFEHIKSSYDLSVIRVKPKGTNLHAGDKFTCVAKIKNIGTVASERVKIYFYITDDGTLEAGQPPAIIKVVKKATFLPLPPGKAKLIKLAAKIPTWIGSGNYVLVAKVDPTEKSDDADFSNNIKTGSKKLKIKE